MALVVLAIINVSVGYVVCRWDMTDDKRYSISEATKMLLQELDEPIGVTLLLDGELNSGFVRLKKATEEMVDELGIYAGEGLQILPATEELSLQFTPTVFHERTH